MVDTIISFFGGLYKEDDLGMNTAPPNIMILIAFQQQTHRIKSNENYLIQK